MAKLARPVIRRKNLGHFVWGYRFDGIWYFETWAKTCLGSWNPETGSLRTRDGMRGANTLEDAVVKAAEAVPRVIAAAKAERKREGLK